MEKNDALLFSLFAEGSQGICTFSDITKVDFQKMVRKKKEEEEVFPLALLYRKNI